MKFEFWFCNVVVWIVEDLDWLLEFVFNVEVDLEYGGCFVCVWFDFVLDSFGKVWLSV